MRPAGVMPCQLERRLGRLGTRVAKGDATRPCHRRGRRKTLGHGDLFLVVEVGARHVQISVDLPADRLHHMRVPVPSRADGDAGVQVEEPVAVGVVDHHTETPVDDERVVPGVGGAEHRVVPLDDRRGPRSGQVGHELRRVRLFRNEGERHGARLYRRQEAGGRRQERTGGLRRPFERTDRDAALATCFLLTPVSRVLPPHELSVSICAFWSVPL